MSTDPTPSTHLHLPSLSIQGFRGIQQLDISRLGRVTLFAGKNGVGKTTILEAIRVYAARGSYHIFTDLLDAREELIESVNGEGDKSPAPDWKSLFFGWPISPDAGIAIGSPVDGDFLTIELSTLSRQETEGLPRQRAMFRLLSDDETNEPCLRIDYNDMSRMIPISYSDMYSRRAYPSRYSLRMYQKDDKGFASEVLCESLGPGLMSNNDMARFWDNIALTDNETRAVSALQLIFGNHVERVAVIGDDRSSRQRRRAVARIMGRDHPIPLKSLGDGALRIFGAALALANSQGGFLVIDEVENGIHHSVQRDFWTMVLKTAQANNVQVLATTHGWDCVRGFAQAAEDVDEVEAALVRLEKDGDIVRAIEYSEQNLRAAARSGIEVR